MSGAAEQFPFLMSNPALGVVSLAPLLPITLSRGEQVATTSGLLDTGAAVNVMP